MSSSIYHGAMVDDSKKGNESVSIDQIKKFESNAGKKLATVYFTDKWAQSDVTFPKNLARIVTENGSTPFLRIQNSEDADGAPGSAGKFAWKRICDGKLDTQLKKYASDVKTFYRKILIEFGTEINGKWFSWADEGPDAFKKGFRYIVNLFQAEGVTNAEYAFHCDATDNSNSAKWYPGDNVCDWVGTSCYGGYGSGKGCIDTLDDCYDDFAAISKKARLAILEWGAPDPKDIEFNVEDTRKTLKELPNKYPRIEMLQRWCEKVIPHHGEDQIGDGRIDITPEMLKAYREGIKSDVYVSKYE